ncbi:amidohydrolase family protein [Lutimaribacter marinistellae]|uniref:Amidohydrolase family protein n=1 Tax=Lutimaribacter marinistellae TaxID=1820329 RepID=A0ABV7TFG8_9RHOB
MTRITNCHVHLFNHRHIPGDYPYRILRFFKSAPFLIRWMAAGLRVIGQHPAADRLERLYRFNNEADADTQAEVFEALAHHYPSDTRFVVLPMELSAFGYGAPEVPLSAQHDELAALTRAHPANIIPFATIDPRADPQATELWRAIDTLGFRGVKLYPRMGFSPSDPRLMEHVYPELERRGLPVMTHCSRGGLMGHGMSEYSADRFTEPQAYIPVLKAHPSLRICLAHFGGSRDWAAYARPDPKAWNDDAQRDNWQRRIRRMIGSGAYPNLWTDISYTLFNFEDYAPFLRIFLMGEDEESERLRDRVLFGSDFYMTRQEKLSEREVCFRLRNTLGEEMFRKLAEENPARWLGET